MNGKSLAIKMILVLVLILAGALGMLALMMKFLPQAKVSAMTREGVITEIQSLNRLTTVAFGVDTVITAEKQGNWYKLWQDEQKGLFVAHGRVLAGVDLTKLTPEMVQVHYDEQPDSKIAPKAHIEITLPPSEIFEVYLDNIQVYDWKTGLFGMVNNDPEVLTQAQIQGKTEVLNKACQGDVMTMALNNARNQIQALFMLTGATVQVTASSAGLCRLP